MFRYKNILGLSLLCMGFSMGIAQYAQAAPAAQVDFARTASAPNQIGFMHGAMTDYHVAASTPAVIQRASELMPGMWRGADLPWSMDSGVALGMGATPVYVLSDLWNANTPNPKAGCKNMFWNRPLPFQNMQVWRAWVTQQINQIGLRQPSGAVWIDVWNEPDISMFWPAQPNPRCYSNRIVDRDGSKYLMVFAAAEKIIRQKLGRRAKIIGASTAGGAFDWTNKILLYCAKVGCRLDAVAWHFAGGSQKSVDLLGSYAAKLRSGLARNRAWRKASLGTRTPLWMTEYLPAPYHLMPGSLLSYWYAQERAGIAKAAICDWRDAGSRLNSLLESDGTPRSIWWAARAYAQGRSHRVATSTNSGYYSVLASRSGLGDVPQILVGNNAAASRTQTIGLSGLDKVGITSRLVWSYHPLPVAVRGQPFPQLPDSQPGGSVAVRSGKAAISVRVPSGGMWVVDLAAG